MPFDSTTGPAAGFKYGKRGALARWGVKDPASVRNRSLLVKVSDYELELIDAKTVAHGISRTELVVRAVRDYPDGGAAHAPGKDR